jgi:PKD repeat protein
VLSISPGGVATFKDSSSYGKYYSWTFGDGTSLLDSASGATVHGYGTSGTYTVTEIVSDSCGLKDTMTIHITVLITGINEINGFSAVSLYPNPASNYCTISISASQTQETDVEVTNILGQLVSTQKWQVNEGSDKLNLDVSAMASGMYTVTIRAASGVITMKLDIIK